MIGNGFDMGLGMATSFKQFFPVYRAKSLDKEENIKQLSQSITDDEEAWSYFEKQLGVYTSEFDEETSVNFKHQVNDFTSEFIAYLRLQEERLSFDDEQVISKTISNALTSFYKDGNLPTESYSCISQLFQNNVYDEHRYNFISFNYTDSLQKCLGCLKDNIVATRKLSSSTTKTDRIGIVVNVHGTKDGYPIMGVNDKTQIANKELAENKSFTDRLIKPQLNSRLRMNNEGQAINVLNSSKIICIYGMSLGETDRDWWDRVITWLHNDSSRQLVIFNYDDKYSTSLPTNWLDKEDGIIEQLTSYNKNKDINVDNLRSRIHIAVHKNIFSMPLTKKSDEINEMAMEQLKEMCTV